MDEHVESGGMRQTNVTATAFCSKGLYPTRQYDELEGLDALNELNMNSGQSCACDRKRGAGTLW